jgi:hypothetical protein
LVKLSRNESWGVKQEKYAQNAGLESLTLPLSGNACQDYKTGQVSSQLMGYAMMIAVQMK